MNSITTITTAMDNKVKSVDNKVKIIVKKSKTVIKKRKKLVEIDEPIETVETVKSIKTVEPVETDQISLYIKSLTVQEKQTLDIATSHLGTSFNIKRSIGFLGWKSKQS